MPGITSMRTVGAALLALSLALAVAPAQALTTGQTDTFQDGTTNGWFAGGGPIGQTPPVPPANVATGGPAGAGDAFLAITATGTSGPGSRLVAINTLQWAGDYVAAGIGAIAMDVINLGTTDLSLRLLFAEVDLALLNLALSAAPVLLPAGSGWTSVVFPVAADALTALQGTALGALSNATELRIVHTTQDTLPISTVTGLLGVDNIAALESPPSGSVPEPDTLALLGGAIAAFAVIALIRRKRRGK
jgi:hypothetical protein